MIVLKLPWMWAMIRWPGGRTDMTTLISIGLAMELRPQGRLRTSLEAVIVEIKYIFTHFTLDVYHPLSDIKHINFLYSIIISLPKNRYNIIYIISWKEWYDRISYIIFLSFQKKMKLAIFYILFINNQSSKHT
jgi:hypothetical protein